MSKLYRSLLESLQVRPYLMADGGNVSLVEIDGLVVRLKLQGACGSCPSSLTTMTMGIKRKLMEKIPEIIDVEQARRRRYDPALLWPASG